MAAPKPEVDAPFSNNIKGAIWILISAIGATAMSVAVKFLGDSQPTPQIAFLRTALGMWVILPILFWPKAASAKHPGTKTDRKIRFSKPWLHFLRGALFAVAVNCGFYALSILPLATATTLFFLAPIFTTALAALFTAEKVGPKRWVAVALGFLGAMIVLQPGWAPPEPAMLAAIGSALSFAVALLITRPLSEADGESSIMVSTTLIGSLLTLGPGLYFWQPISASLYFIIVLLVIASTIRLFADIRAYSIAEASFLAPFAFMRLLFIVLAGWMIFHETLETRVILGAIVILAAGMFIAHRERQTALSPQKDDPQTRMT